MRYNESDVIRVADETGVKFAELLFCSVFGELMSLTVPCAELPEIFRSGFALDASKLDGFMEISDTDLVLRPSPESMTVSADGQLMRLFCNISRPDGTPFEGDGRYYLYLTADRARKMGLELSIGLTGEYYLFMLDENGRPVKTPVDTACRCGAALHDSGAGLRREVCSLLEQWDIPVRSLCHGEGPGQSSVSLKPLPPMLAADAYMLYMSETRAAAQSSGLYASFMPMPLSDKSGSSLDISIFCRENGADVFRQTDGRVSASAGKIIGGLIRSLPAMTLFLNSITNSYARLERSQLLGKAAWSRTNADTALRLRTAREGQGELVLRSPDSSGNIYFSLGLIINACIEGVNQGISAPRPVKADGTHSTGADKLPTTLAEAIKAAEYDGFIRSVTDARMFAYLLEAKRRLCRDFEEVRDKESFETMRFFRTL